MRAALAALLVLYAAAAAGEGGAERLEPVGIWNCLFYGPGGTGRAFLKLTPERTVHIARVRDAYARRWSALSGWQSSRGALRFTDHASGRAFTADMGRSTLAGSWREGAMSGGWWCSPVANLEARDDRERPPAAGALLTELVPAIMASPNYPRQAIRSATEGQAVSCYFVNGNGDISNVEVMEVSDDIFHEPALVAVSDSRYRSWDDEQQDAVLPACRTFRFELDAIR